VVATERDEDQVQRMVASLSVRRLLAADVADALASHLPLTTMPLRAACCGLGRALARRNAMIGHCGFVGRRTAASEVIVEVGASGTGCR